ncbi:hypothetical protein CROQUDRAFT_46963 [Cronartium quercuum f. sp. fusiforme G11]|uniref:Glycosyltransferase family 49 protein n=1 Tax=Cronartium quercuum f. sp. fusiforme G11 TaxID=708437 RepID=A0A9P6NEZ8_9BASI|nr:hypothetical protein CROQUDRAFT_46963 [Cronartium quercuum f. sp. fusiforme G11]
MSFPHFQIRTTSNETKKSTNSILKSIFTIYLLSAIIYSSFTFIIQPIFETVLENNLFNLSILNKSFTNSKSNTITSSLIEITPRLLPGDAHFLPIPDLTIRRTLKGTSVNTDEVVKEDETSLWNKPRSQNHRNRNQNQSNTSRTTVLGFDPSLEPIRWYPPHHPLSGIPNHLKLPSTVRLNEELNHEDFFYSKAFSDSLGPNKVIPYFYRAKGPLNDGKFDQDEVTINTLVTSNRFKVFSKLVDHYQGPISATIHVSNDPETLEPLLASLEKIYKSSTSMTTWVDIHLVVDSFDRQFNMWRNVAKLFSRTDYVMMLDVDFWICTNFRKHLKSSPLLLKLLKKGKIGLVIPAFEFTKQIDGVNSNKFPNKKSDLLELFQNGQIDMFHKSWLPGHGPTNYTKFFENDDPYPISGYTHSYEPYVIYRKDSSPFCDERFIGYGGNKAACLFELYLSGVTFYVLPNDFLIHQSHPYAEQTRQHERKFNRKLFTDFREEVCFRKLSQFFQNGSLFKFEISKNLLNECKKVSLSSFFLFFN